MSVVINSSRKNIDDSLYILNNDNALSLVLPEIADTSYRLNTQVSNYDPLEQYVSQIAKFHSSRLNLPDNQRSCVEFSIITPTINRCDIVYDKPNYAIINKKNSPVFTIIVSLGDYTHPFILTDINHQQHKYKQFDNQKCIKLFFLKKHMHLVFDSSKYHGFVNTLNDDNDGTSNPYLLINLWSYPLNIPYYSSQIIAADRVIPMEFTDINEPGTTHMIDTSALNYNFFYKLLYNSNCILDNKIITNINAVNTNLTHRIIMQMQNDTEPMSTGHVSTDVTSSKYDNINTWCISNHKYHDNLLQDINKFRSDTFLLDLTKSNYTLIEKYVYDIAMFHLSRMRIHDVENYYVEFWCKSKIDTHRLHINCDESMKRKGSYVYPLLSCVTYLNDVSNCPTIITNVDMDCYKYKEFESQTEVILSLPAHNKQITFDGRLFHGSTTLFDSQDNQDRYIIAINFWKAKPYDVKYYNPNTENELIIETPFVRDDRVIDVSEDTTNICSINVCSDTINYSLFNDILYNKPADVCYRFNEFIKTTPDNRSHTFKFVLDNSIKENKKYEELNAKYGGIMEDIRDITNNATNLKYNNRFLQRFVFPKIYSADMCRYIINETENYITHNRGDPDYLPIDKIPSIFGIILETLKTITNKISISYGLHDDMLVDIKDLFVIKYTDYKQNSLEMNCDDTFISFSVLLNNNNDFVERSVFDDGLTVNLGQGDILLHNNIVKHTVIPNIKGYSYRLVGVITFIAE
jgi:hypothetical protein